MLDQIRFSRAILDLKGLQDRYAALMRDVHPKDDRARRLVRGVLTTGEMGRGGCCTDPRDQ